MRLLKRSIMANSLELQFWGYEIGNLFAAVAGSGGFASFFAEINAVVSNPNLDPVGKALTLAHDHPDAFVTIALGIVVLLAPPMKNLVSRAGRLALINLFDAAMLIAAVLILTFTLNADTSWLTDAAASFVVGSSLLRQSKRNPFLMKPGSLALSLGGIALAAFWVVEVTVDLETSDEIGLALSAIAIATGVYVLAAGLLTYQGGVFETARFLAASKGRTVEKDWAAGLLHPHDGILPRLFETLLDRPVVWFCDGVVKPAIFWVSAHTKRERPFVTSMWARLPWRLFSGGLAFATATPQGMVFGLANICWAVGDVAIGSLDWTKDQEP